MKLFAAYLILCAALGVATDVIREHRDKTGAAANSIELHGAPPALKVLK